MGQAPSAPVLDKEDESGENTRVAYAMTAMQGWRDSMEDAHTAKLKLGDDDHNTFFAVYDGHADESIVSKFASESVWQKLKANEAYASKDYSKAFVDAFLATDAEIRANNLVEETGGATAVAMIYTTDDEIFVANAGDSRCVLSSMGHAKPLSTDHRPELEAEKARIMKAGGFVSEDNRVNGLLAPSRALGDFFYKQRGDLPPTEQMVTAEPEIVVHQVTAEDEFVVVACDGIWDVFSSQEVVDSVRRMIALGASLQDCANRLVDASLSPQFGGIGCDNMTIIVCALLQGLSLEGWAARIKERVEKGEGRLTPEQLPVTFSPIHQAEAREEWARIRAEKEANKDLNRPPSPVTIHKIAIPASLFT
ncbi:protein phosphatase 2C Ptc2 [Auriculariales sp. MPI-PUGE-AT-0066]|nr:protein phosphatase 2C Ptc2 [Auriculariales sp. MPI-PUGE-AT-0066]